ncbi:MAG: hypothetical protein ACK4NY_08230 [Spirosomataceae bacterium]
MIVAAKVLNSTNQWQSVTPLYDVNNQVGVTGFINNQSYQYGFEQWLNNDILKDLKLGYLDCYRSHNFNDLAERVIIFQLLRGNIWYIGNLYGVKQLCYNEIEEIQNQLIEQNWLDIINNNFIEIGDLRLLDETHEYLQHYNANHIVGNPDTNPFILNIRYSELKLLTNPINLTQIYPQINNKWRRLSIRYNNIPNELIQIFDL